MSASVNQEFLLPIQSLAKQAVACGNATVSGQGRVWMTANITADPARPESIKAAMPVSDIAAEFQSVLNSTTPGSVGVAASLRIQRDMVMSLRRAMVQRYASQVRVAMFGAANQLANEATVGVCAVAYVQDLIRAGQGRVGE